MGRSHHLITSLLVLALIMPAFQPLSRTVAAPDEPVVPGTAIPAQTTDARQVVIFVQGINTSYDPPTVSPVPQFHVPSNFEVIKERLIDDLGYQSTDFIDFSYAPEAYENGHVSLVPYTCSQTGQDPFQSGASLRKLIENVHAMSPENRIVLVGHSLGGVVITWALDGLDDGPVADAIAGVVTIGSPLYGARSDDVSWMYAGLIWLTLCPESHVLTDSTAAQRLQAELDNFQDQLGRGGVGLIETHLADSLGRFHDRGARVGTFGNRYDCIYNHIDCGTLLTSILPGSGGFGDIDISWTQIYPFADAPIGYSHMYSLSGYWPECRTFNWCVPDSHSYLLDHPQDEMLEAIGPAVVVDPVDHSQLPEAFTGRWFGHGTQTAPAITWPITIELTGGSTGEVIGAVDYPADPCRGDLTLVAVESLVSMTVTEAITEGRCLDGGTFALTLTARGDLQFTWDHPSDDTVAEGLLTREPPTIDPIDEPVPPVEHDPSTTADVWIGVSTCTSSTMVEFHNLGQADNFSGFPDCSGTAPATTFTITDSTGATTTVVSTPDDGPIELSLPLGPTTLTEIASGESFTFEIPPLNLNGRFPEVCAGRAGCVGIIVTIPEDAGSDPYTGFPEWYLGSWEGTGNQTNPAISWPITFTFFGGEVGVVVGTVEYPTLGCGGELTYLERVSHQYAEDTFNFTEDITWGEENCTDGGTFFTWHSEGCCTIGFDWSAPDGSSTAEGTLMPVDGSQGITPAGNLISPSMFGLTYVVESDGIWLIGTDGAINRIVEGDVRGPAWSPDGVRLAYIRQQWFEEFGVGFDQIEIATPVESETVVAVPQPDGDVSVAYGSVQWSADGSALYYLANYGPYYKVLRQIDLRTGAETELSLPGLIPGTFRVASDDTIVLHAQPEDAGVGTHHLYLMESGVAPVLLMEIWESSFLPAWSPDASRIALAVAGVLMVIDRDTGATRTIADLGEVDVFDVAWPPEGRTIAFTIADDAPALTLFTIPASGGPVTKHFGANDPTWQVVPGTR